MPKYWDDDPRGMQRFWRFQDLMVAWINDTEDPDDPLQCEAVGLVPPRRRDDEPADSAAVDHAE